MPEPVSALSIVMPVLNEAAGIDGRAAGAGAAARARRTRCVVADGGSADDTLALAQRFERRRGDSGAARARAADERRGAAASGDGVLLFLHADTHAAAGRRSPDRAGARRRPPRWGRFDVRIDGPPPDAARGGRAA